MFDWQNDGLPVLRALHDPADYHLREGILMLGRGRGASLGLDLDDDLLHDVVLALGDLGYVEYNEITYEAGGGAYFSGIRVAGRGLQVLGEWPRFEAMTSASTLGQTLERLADYAPDDDERTRVQRAGRFVRSFGTRALKTTTIAVGSHLARGALGLP
jgi:hypothetical protein